MMMINQKKTFGKMNDKKQLLALTALVSIPSMLMAQAANSNSTLDWVFDNLLFIFIALLVIGALVSLFMTMETIVKSKQQEFLAEHGVSLPEEKAGESYFSKFWDKLIGMVPMEKEKDIDLGHDYDGIRELDNSLPPWWIYLFYFTIIWGAVYFYIYQMSDIGSSQQEEYESAMEIAEDQRRAFLFKQANLVNETNVMLLSEAEELAEGEQLFKSQCASCHGMLGEGGIGPNFTDKYWIHGGDIKDLFRTIKYGVPEKGMISWQTQLKPASMQKVASYILTLQGTNPPNQKKAEGELYENTGGESEELNSSFIK
jgi:cytochrome c oxidase cbb3-type subunit 3